MPSDSVSIPDEERLSGVDAACALCLALLTLLSRAIERTPLYFVDGPRIVQSIQAGTYTIQSPGYWMFAHLGGTFHDPVQGLSFWNQVFCALGAAAFFWFCRGRGLTRVTSVIASLAYSFVFFAWFAGEIHSSYASQMLFPPLALACFDRYLRRRHVAWLLAWSLAAALGMGLRPSDGVFLLPLWLYLLLRFEPETKRRVLFLLMQAAVFLSWDLPTRLALAKAHQPGSGALILLSMRTVSPLVIGIQARSVANMLRVVVPMFVAFWALVPALLSRHPRETRRQCLLWVLPGTVFTALCYMADPMYLLFCSGAWVFYAASSARQRLAAACLGICFVFNAALFLTARPMSGEERLAQVTNFMVVKYTRYGLQHHWSSTLGSGAEVPR